MDMVGFQKGTIESLKSDVFSFLLQTLKATQTLTFLSPKYYTQHKEGVVEPEHTMLIVNRNRNTCSLKCVRNLWPPCPQQIFLLLFSVQRDYQKFTFALVVVAFNIFYYNRRIYYNYVEKKSQEIRSNAPFTFGGTFLYKSTIYFQLI